VSNIIRRHIDKRKLLLICNLLLADYFIFFMFYFYQYPIYFCVVLCIVCFFFCRSVYCLCVNVCHRVSTELQLKNISYHVSGQVYTSGAVTTRRQPSIYTKQKAGWTSEPVWIFRERINFLLLPGMEPRFLDRVACNYSVYRLSYLSSLC
jgi:hypothetical protein